MSMGAKGFSTLLVALVLFGLAGSLVMVAVPRLFVGPLGPGFMMVVARGPSATLRRKHSSYAPQALPGQRPQG